MVYAVFVSLGFAAVENVMYVLTSGFETAVARAVFAIPGHMMFGVVMGVGIAQAKWSQHSAQPQAAKQLRRRAFLAAAVLHGLYDFLLVGFGAFFYLYFIFLLVWVLRLLRRSAKEDRPIE